MTTRAAIVGFLGKKRKQHGPPPAVARCSRYPACLTLIDVCPLDRAAGYVTCPKCGTKVEVEP